MLAFFILFYFLFYLFHFIISNCIRFGLVSNLLKIILFLKFFKQNKVRILD